MSRIDKQTNSIGDMLFEVDTVFWGPFVQMLADTDNLPRPIRRPVNYYRVFNRKPVDPPTWAYINRRRR